jgi:conjugative relaxase-like TrwC/TraI family protein
VLSHKILTRRDVGRAASYYEDGADDYYAGEGEVSAWQGRGAEALGLEGAVDSARFRELLAGRVTSDGISSHASRGRTRTAGSAST